MARLIWRFRWPFRTSWCARSRPKWWPLLGEVPQAPSPWLDVHQAAAYLRCGKQRVYDLVSAGALSPGRDGRRLLFRREQLDAYLTNGADE